MTPAAGERSEEPRSATRRYYLPSAYNIYKTTRLASFHAGPMIGDVVRQNIHRREVQERRRRRDHRTRVRRRARVARGVIVVALTGPACHVAMGVVAMVVVAAVVAVAAVVVSRASAAFVIVVRRRPTRTRRTRIRGDVEE